MSAHLQDRPFPFFPKNKPHSNNTLESNKNQHVLQLKKNISSQSQQVSRLNREPMQDISFEENLIEAVFYPSKSQNRRNRIQSVVENPQNIYQEYYQTFIGSLQNDVAHAPSSGNLFECTFKPSNLLLNSDQGNQNEQDFAFEASQRSFEQTYDFASDEEPDSQEAKISLPNPDIAVNSKRFCVSTENSNQQVYSPLKAKILKQVKIVSDKNNPSSSNRQSLSIKSRVRTETNQSYSKATMGIVDRNMLWLKQRQQKLHKLKAQEEENKRLKQQLARKAQEKLRSQKPKHHKSITELADVSKQQTSKQTTKKFTANYAQRMSLAQENKNIKSGVLALVYKKSNNKSDAENTSSSYKVSSRNSSHYNTGIMKTLGDQNTSVVEKKNFSKRAEAMYGAAGLVSRRTPCNSSTVNIQKAYMNAKDEIRMKLSQLNI